MGGSVWGYPAPSSPTPFPRETGMMGLPPSTPSLLVQTYLYFPNSRPSSSGPLQTTGDYPETPLNGSHCP